MTFGAKLHALRTDAGLSQEALAARLGVSRQAVSKWELDKTVPDAAAIVTISDIFRVSTDYLLKDGATTAPSSPEVPAASEGSSFSGGTTHPPTLGVSDRACLLLSVGVRLFTALLLLYMLYDWFGFRNLGNWPMFLVLLTAPILLAASRRLLTASSPLRRFRRSVASCMTLWGLAIAMLCGFMEVVDDLLILGVEGPAGIPIFLGLLALLLVPLWCAGWVLAKYLTRKFDP